MPQWLLAIATSTSSGGVPSNALTVDGAVVTDGGSAITVSTPVGDVVVIGSSPIVVDGHPLVLPL